MEWEDFLDRVDGGPASEATLQRIENLLVGQTKSSAAGGGSTAAKVESSQKKLAKTTAQATSSIEALDREADKNTKSLKKLDDAVINSSISFTKSMGGMVKGLAAGGEGIAGVVKGLGSAAGGIASKFGGIGKIIGAGATGVAAGFAFALGAAQRVSDTFYSTAKSGATFGGSLMELKLTSDRAGYGLENFSKAVAKNSAGLATFGGGATAGARALSGVLAATRGTQLEKSLQGMGIALKEQPEFFAQYLSDMGSFGLNQKRLGTDLASIAKTAVGYQKSLTVISELTGEDADAMKKKLEAAKNDAAFQAKMREISRQDPERAKGIVKAIAMLPLAQQAAAREMIVLNGAVRNNIGAFEAGRPLMQDFYNATLAGADAPAVLEESMKNNAAKYSQHTDRFAQTMQFAGHSSSEFIKGAQGGFLAMNTLTNAMGETGEGFKDAQKMAEQAGSGVADPLTNNMRNLESASLKMATAIEEIGTKLMADGNFQQGLDAITKSITKLAENLPKIVDKLTGLIDGALGTVSRLSSGEGTATDYLKAGGVAAGVAAVAAPVTTAKLAGKGVAAAGRGVKNLVTGGKPPSPSAPPTGTTETIADMDKKAGGAKPAAGGKNPLSRFPRLGKLMGLMQKVPYIGKVLGAGAIMSMIASGASTGELIPQMSGLLGGIGGTALGAILGGLIGGPAAPITALLGGAVGGYVGGGLATSLSQWLFGEKANGMPWGFGWVDDLLNGSKASGGAAPSTPAASAGNKGAAAGPAATPTAQSMSSSTAASKAVDSAGSDLAAVKPDSMTTEEIQVRTMELLERLVAINQRGFDEEQALLTRISRN